MGDLGARPDQSAESWFFYKNVLVANWKYNSEILTRKVAASLLSGIWVEDPGR